MGSPSAGRTVPPVMPSSMEDPEEAAADRLGFGGSGASGGASVAAGAGGAGLGAALGGALAGRRIDGNLPRGAKKGVGERFVELVVSSFLFDSPLEELEEVLVVIFSLLPVSLVSSVSSVAPGPTPPTRSSRATLPAMTQTGPRFGR